jgi:hypothetical protein
VWEESPYLNLASWIILKWSEFAVVAKLGIPPNLDGIINGILYMEKSKSITNEEGI